MILYLVRHGIAEDRLKYGLKFADDSKRPLTDEGIKKFKKNALQLKKIIGPIDWIVSSPLLRAEQTAKILAKLYPHVKFKTSKVLLPTAQPSEFAKWSKSSIKNKDKRIVIVGHEPHLSLMVSWLLFGAKESRILIKKGACVAIEVNEAIGPSSGLLQWAVTSKTLGVN